MVCVSLIFLRHGTEGLDAPIPSRPFPEFQLDLQFPFTGFVLDFQLEGLHGIYSERPATSSSRFNSASCIYLSSQLPQKGRCLGALYSENSRGTDYLKPQLGERSPHEGLGLLRYPAAEYGSPENL